MVRAGTWSRNLPEAAPNPLLDAVQVARRLASSLYDPWHLLGTNRVTQGSMVAWMAGEGACGRVGLDRSVRRMSTNLSTTIANVLANVMVSAFASAPGMGSRTRCVIRSNAAAS